MVKVRESCGYSVALYLGIVKARAAYLLKPELLRTGWQIALIATRKTSPIVGTFPTRRGNYYNGPVMGPNRYTLLRLERDLASMIARKLAALVFMLFFGAMAARCQSEDSATPDAQQAPSARGQTRQGRGDGPPPLLGKITSVKNGALELGTPDGTNVTVKLSDKTEFRKDRQPAKLADFKVGDTVFVRGEQNADHTVTAVIVAGRAGGGSDGPGGGRGFGGGGAGLGELGKDYIAGEIKSVDAPKLTVLRTDNVTQTIELTEESSLRKGRDSITMAEIQPGDHVIARGSMQDNVFTPKNVMILSAEQWQRMQEFAGRRRGNGENAPGNAPNAPTPAPPQQ
jgi:Domain of unknown function (DUF5666)